MPSEETSGRGQEAYVLESMMMMMMMMLKNGSLPRGISAY
jgi:hypothetical protein